jgi:hypothetical protein
MVVAQRGTSAITVNNTENFPVDRTNVRCGAAGLSATTQQSSVAPFIFRNSIFINVTTGAASGSTDRGYLLQKIEGVNVADFMLGTSAAVTFTLSFWVRSSLTGTFSGSLQNDLQNRSYVFTYTINAANTWEQKIITVAGDTTGTWTTDNTSGIFVLLDLGNGSSLRSGTTNSWINGDFRGFTSAVSLFANSGSTFYITGIQLEAGFTASSFEYRPYGTELALCQRYYYKIFPVESSKTYGNGTSVDTTTMYNTVPSPVTMRVNPSLETTGTASDYAIVRGGGTNTNCNSVPIISDQSNKFVLQVIGTLSSGLQTGYSGWLRTASASSYLAFNAEL